VERRDLGRCVDLKSNFGEVAWRERRRREQRGAAAAG